MGSTRPSTKTSNRNATNAAMPAIQKVSQNAKITPAQKDLLSSVATKFAPGASKVGDALKGVKGIPDLSK